MPYKLPFLEEYTVNYNSLLQELQDNSQKKLFSDEKITSFYIKTFLNLMRNADQTMKQSLQSEAIRQDIKNYYFENQVFQQPIHFTNQDIYIHFRVSEILKLVQSCSLPEIEHVPISSFTGTHAKYGWSIPDNTISSTPSSVPVIAIPYPWEYQDWLIIDGNHRINNSLKSDSHIAVVHINPNFLIESELFATEFDKLFYIFHCESSSLAALKRDYALSDEDLFNRSIIATLTCFDTLF